MDRFTAYYVQTFLKFIYSEKDTKFWEIFTLLLTGTTYTVADYRPFTVQLQLNTLLPCILIFTAAIKVQLR